MRRSSQTYNFRSVFAAELEAINARRDAAARGDLSADRKHPRPASLPYADTPASALHVRLEPDAPADPDERPPVVPEAGHNLTGLALSGGGIRSAAFCLGILQGIDGGKPDTEPQVLDSIDYLSAVSGGNYVATSLVAGTMQAQRFPFASKLDGSETPETQHLRDYSRYLAPAGVLDVVVGLVSVLRGLLINAMIFGALILIAAGATVAFNPTEHVLRHPTTGLRSEEAFSWTVRLAAAVAVVQVIYAIVAGWPSKHRRWTTLANREAWGRLFAGFLIVLACVAVFEAQSYALIGLFDHAYCRPHPNAVGRLLFWTDGRLSVLGTGLVSAMAATAAFASKLSAILRATAGDASWTGKAKRWASLAGLLLAATIVPIAIWVAYLGLAFGGISASPQTASSASCQALTGPLVGRPHATAAAAALGRASPAIWYLVIGGVGLLVSLLVRPNANSLHGYYRDRLSRAFLWKRDELLAEIRTLAVEPPSLRQKAKRLLPAGPPAGLRTLGRATAHRQQRKVDVDEFQFSSLKVPTDAGWTPDVRFSPYLLVNTSVNLEGSKALNKRGRNADSFLFSPLFIGSEATGFVPTRKVEARDLNVNLATAMAISGAAASANMGASTVKPLTFSFSALNIRLGYWLPNPRCLDTRNIAAMIGPYYFARETLGLLDEWSQNVYLTDGGHFDNLGVYELLKRRCRIVMVVDAEADPSMSFGALVRLERYARIDYGVRVDLPWQEIRRRSPLSTDETSAPSGAPRHHGPHVSIGCITYDERTFGILIYMKASLTGDESDLVLDYKRRFSDFPHETTLDQFFGEEQFEAYRTLGFHVASRFLSGEDRAAKLANDACPGWSEALREALIHLNLTPAAVRRIMEQPEA